MFLLRSWRFCCTLGVSAAFHVILTKISKRSENAVQWNGGINDVVSSGSEIKQLYRSSVSKTSHSLFTQKLWYIDICLISPFVLASEMIECIYFKPTL